MAGTVLIAAASVLLLRDDPLEVLMILRHEKSSFVPNVWVFPGGTVDASDGPESEPASFEKAAIREVFEETGIEISDDLVPTSRWITPEGLPKRFDTWFFLAPVPRDVKVTLQESEAVDFRWIEPAKALAAGPDEFPMVFPTMKNLEAIAAFQNREELIRSRRGAQIEPVQPVVVMEGNRKKIRLP